MLPGTPTAARSFMRGKRVSTSPPQMERLGASFSPRRAGRGYSPGLLTGASCVSQLGPGQPAVRQCGKFTPTELLFATYCQVGLLFLTNVVVPGLPTESTSCS